MKFSIDQISRFNKQFRGIPPEEIISWAVNLSNKRIVTTSFGKYSAVLLSTFQRIDPMVKVIWCDTGFNLSETYEHANYLTNRYNLNLQTYVPKETRSYTEHRLGFPNVDEPGHKEFSDIVKLEPFRRALAEHQPEVWFTNIRIRQTALRSAKDILSLSNEGILKVSPFYYWTDDDLDDYLEAHELPKNSSYFDPVKALESRECGIHLQ
ncbi:phosphoadenosine phosphosulfate reductase family protein [Croceitalea marina]|uniref:Phosphoadenosine phosphosulfate reductase family protein n=1 Tax=Croceitalea marina TaxID=1775166 RepID=A0ABW5MWM3_9FLAO